MSIKKLKANTLRERGIFNNLTGIAKMPDPTVAVIQKLATNDVIHRPPPAMNVCYAEWQGVLFPMTGT